jgi:DNA-binding response OmpR family regulator
MKLLVVDDDVKLAKLISSYFENRNWIIARSYSYKDAYDTLMKNKYDIIICDYSL